MFPGMFVSKIQAKDLNGSAERSLKAMGFFQRITNGVARFMYGRNGMDQLNRALLIGYLVLYFAGTLLAGLLQSRPLAWSVEALTTVLAVLLIFRMFSKNLYKRREENQKWVNWWWRFKSGRAGARARHADREHKYFTCKTCRTICRVPVGKGKIVITCPKCGAQIQAKT